MKRSLAHLPQRKRGENNIAAFQLHQAADYCPQLRGIIPRESESQKELFELLDYAYIGAGYDIHYKITPEELKYLARCVELLKEQVETSCEAKMESFV